MQAPAAGSGVHYLFRRTAQKILSRQQASHALCAASGMLAVSSERIAARIHVTNKF